MLPLQVKLSFTDKTRQMGFAMLSLPLLYHGLNLAAPMVGFYKYLIMWAILFPKKRRTFYPFPETQVSYD